MKKYGFLPLIAALLALLTLVAACGGTSDPQNTEPASTAAGTEAETPADDPAFFVFEQEEYEGSKYYVLAGITEEGKKQKKLTVPAEYEGMTVLALNAGCFAGCTALEEVTIGSNVRELYENLFEGCTALKKVRLDFRALYEAIKADPAVVDSMLCSTAGDGTVGGENSILQGLDEKKVRLVFSDRDTYDYFSSEYTWGVFASVMVLE